MDKLECDIKVYDNIIEITPIEGMMDNCEYTIKIGSIESKNKKCKEDKINISFCTAFSPCYCSIDLVKSVTNGCKLEDKLILYHIRESSRFADYLIQDAMRYNKQLKRKEKDFEVEQFVKYKTAYDCVLTMFIDKTTNYNTSKGSLGDINFENSVQLPDITKLLQTIQGEVKVWQSALTDVSMVNRGAMKSAVKGSTAFPVQNIFSTYENPMIRINNDYDRGV